MVTVHQLRDTKQESLAEEVQNAINSFKVEHNGIPEMSFDEFVKESGFEHRHRRHSTWGREEGRHVSFTIMLCTCGNAQEGEKYHYSKCEKCGSGETHYLPETDNMLHSYYKFEPLSNTAFKLTRYDLICTPKGSWQNMSINLQIVKRGELHYDLNNKVNRMEIIRKNGKVERTKNFSKLAKYLLHNEYGHKENRIMLSEIEKIEYVANRTGLIEYFTYRAKEVNREVTELYASEFLDFLEYHQDNPQIEQLIKTEKFAMAYEVMKNNVKLSTIFGNETKARKFFKLPRNIQAKLTNFQSDQIRALEQIYERSRGFSIESMDYLIEHHLMSPYPLGAIQSLTRYGYRLDELVQYAERADLYQAIPKVEALNLLNDYVRMATLTGIPYKKFTNNLKKDHDLMVREFKFVEDKKRSEMYELEKEKIRHLEYEEKNFAIIVPETLNDIVCEGKELSHCVASYIRSVSEGVTTILFCRKKDELDKPFYTIEVRNGHVTQVKGLANRAIDSSELRSFIKRWKKAKVLV